MATAPVGALRDEVSELFAGTAKPGPPTIGIELELIPYRVTDHGPVPIDDVRGVLADLDSISYEPGGQIELNPPPAATVTGACARIAALEARVAARLARVGVATAALGVNPWHTVDELGLQLRSDRYVAMDSHFQRIGPAGRAFMRRTASTQLCVGMSAGPDGMRQWRVANLVAPVFAALFANSPGFSRTAICRSADPARSRHGNPPLSVADYVDFAQAAAPLDASFANDPRAHLSTLFPPVRPRGGYLEFRALDALPAPRIATAASLLACLLADPATAFAAEGACAPAEQRALWDAAARPQECPAIRDLGNRLILLALAAIPRLPEGYLPAGAELAFAQLAESLTG